MTADTGTASPVRPLAELHDELDELVTAELAKASIPGMGVGIVRGEDELVVTAGVTGVEHPVAVDSRTLFQIGSTTKTLTATAVMSLVEHGGGLGRVSGNHPLQRGWGHLDRQPFGVAGRSVAADQVHHPPGDGGQRLR